MSLGLGFDAIGTGDGHKRGTSQASPTVRHGAAHAWSGHVFDEHYVRSEMDAAGWVTLSSPSWPGLGFGWIVILACSAPLLTVAMLRALRSLTFISARAVW